MKFWLVVLTTVGLGLLAGAGHVGVGTTFRLGLDAWDLALVGAALALPQGGPGAVFLNPAGLAYQGGLSALSSYGGQFAVASVSSLAVAIPWLGLGGVVVSSEPEDGGVAYHSEGAALGVGVPVAPGFALGGRLKVLHPVLPEEGWGWAVDLAALIQGPVYFGILVEGLLSQPATPGEEWPVSASLGLGLDLPLPPPVVSRLALVVTGLGEDTPSGGLGVELWAGELGLRAGITSDTLAVGASLGWGMFRLHLAALLGPLAPTLRASLIVNF